MSLQLYLPIYLTLYLLVTFVVPTWRVWRQTGVNPITFGTTDNAHDFIGQVMKVLIALLVVAVAGYCIGGNFYQTLLPLTYLEVPFLGWTGLAFIHISLVWVMVAQAQMARSWRIGIDNKHKTDLVTSGVFAWSRNPIFSRHAA